jgi:hypothetical protein
MAAAEDEREEEEATDQPNAFLRYPTSLRQERKHAFDLWRRVDVALSFPD